jgi:hypothetical protein
LATLQERRLGYHSRAGLEPGTSRFSTRRISHYAAARVTTRPRYSSPASSPCLPSPSLSESAGRTAASPGDSDATSRKNECFHRRSIVPPVPGAAACFVRVVNTEYCRVGNRTTDLPWGVRISSFLRRMICLEGKILRVRRASSRSGDNGYSALGGSGRFRCECLLVGGTDPRPGSSVASSRTKGPQSDFLISVPVAGAHFMVWDTIFVSVGF